MPAGYKGSVDAPLFLQLMAEMTGLWLWGLCLWFFIVSVGAHWQAIYDYKRGEKHHIGFEMTWFSFVFPNTALVTATLAIGDAFGSNAIKCFGTVMAGLLILMWIFVFVTMVIAFCEKRLLWPDEHEEPEIWRKGKNSNVQV